MMWGPGFDEEETCSYLRQRELEDEVMALRATVQVLRNAHETNMETIEDLNLKLQTMTNDRHVQHTLAQKYKAECAELRAECDAAHKRGWNEGWDAATEAHLGDPPLCT